MPTLNTAITAAFGQFQPSWLQSKSPFLGPNRSMLQYIMQCHGLCATATPVNPLTHA
jgi:hypothetical protein